MVPPSCFFLENGNNNKEKHSGFNPPCVVRIPSPHSQQGARLSQLELEAKGAAAAAAATAELEAPPRSPWPFLRVLKCSWRRFQSFPAGPSCIPKECLLLIYMFNALLTACVYFGFPALRRMLLSSGTYAWLCEEPAEGAAETAETAAAAAKGSGDGGREDAGLVVCNSQEAHVASLFTVAFVSHSVMSGVAGTLLDHMGPKKTAFIGQVLNMLGWLLLASSSQRFPAYIPAFVCMGLSADTCYLPLLKIVVLFGKRSGIVISLLGVACTASFSIPMVLEHFWRSQPHLSFANICELYVLFGPSICLPIALVWVPWKAFSPVKRQKETEGDTCIQTKTKINIYPRACSTGSSLPSTLSTAAPAAAGDTSASPTASIVVPMDHLETPEAAATDNGDSEDLCKEAMTSSSNITSSSCSSSSCSSSSCSSSSCSSSNRSVFLTELFSYRFLCICIFACSQQLAISFYQLAAPRLLQSSVADQMDRFLSLAFIPCVVIGAAIDYLGTFRVLLFMNSLGLLAYIFTRVSSGSLAPHVLSLLCFCGFVSLDSELVFCCVNQFFSAGNFGKLAGTAQASGGFVSLLSIPLYNVVSLQHYGGDCGPVSWAIAACLLCMYPLLAGLLWLDRRGTRRSSSCCCRAAAAAEGQKEETAAAAVSIELASSCC